MKTCRIQLALGAALLLLAAPVAWADLTLTSIYGNSTAVIDTDSPGGLGMIDWTLDGKDYLFQQWFWYRIGDVGPELPISAMPKVFEGALGSNVGSVTYSDGDLSVNIIYTLTSLPDGSVGDIAESITVHKSTAAEVNFFQYSDFDLTANDSVLLVNNNVWRQIGPGFILSETSGIPTPNGWEAALFPITADKLNDGDADDLSNTPPVGVPLGPGNVTWAWQWIGPDGDLLISKNKQLRIVPAPGAVALIGIGLGLVGWFKRRMA